jgi:hypothetical protein
MLALPGSPCPERDTGGWRFWPDLGAVSLEAALIGMAAGQSVRWLSLLGVDNQPERRIQL